MMQTIDHQLYDLNSPLSYSWVARKCKVHAEQAKTMLESWYRQQHAGTVRAKYLVSGIDAEGCRKVQMVDQESVQDAKNALDKVYSCHIYSVFVGQVPENSEEKQLYQNNLHEILYNVLLDQNNASLEDAKTPGDVHRSSSIAVPPGISFLEGKMKKLVVSKQSAPMEIEGETPAPLQPFVSKPSLPSSSSKSQTTSKRPTKTKTTVPAKRRKSSQQSSLSFAKVSSTLSQEKVSQSDQMDVDDSESLSPAVSQSNVQESTSQSSFESITPVQSQSSYDSPVHETSQSTDDSPVHETYDSPVKSESPAESPVSSQQTPTSEPTSQESSQQNVKYVRKQVPHRYVDENGYMVTKMVYENVAVPLSDSEKSSSIAKARQPFSSKTKKTKTKQKKLSSFFTKANGDQISCSDDDDD